MSSHRTAVLEILHRTRYTYSEKVELSRHKSFLTPRMTATQQVEKSRLTLEPPPRESTALTDCYGNPFTLFVVDAPHRELLIDATSRVTILGDLPRTPAPGSVDQVRRTVRESATRDDLEAFEFCFRSPHIPYSRELAEYARECLDPDGGFLTGVGALMARIHSEFAYDPSISTVSTPVSEVFRNRGGVCQDFAHVMIACLRSLGLPARYVSGYLVPGPNVLGAQASHAWVSAYTPGTGWIDFDPTNNVQPSGSHITLAWGRDYSDVSPLGGVMTGGGEHEISVEVQVERS